MKTFKTLLVASFIFFFVFEEKIHIEISTPNLTMVIASQTSTTQSIGLEKEHSLNSEVKHAITKTNSDSRGLITRFNDAVINGVTKITNQLISIIKRVITILRGIV